MFYGFGVAHDSSPPVAEWTKRYSKAELAVMVIFWPLTLLMALQLVPGILAKMRGEDDEADE